MISVELATQKDNDLNRPTSTDGSRDYMGSDLPSHSGRADY